MEIDPQNPPAARAPATPAPSTPVHWADSLNITQVHELQMLVRCDVDIDVSVVLDWIKLMEYQGFDPIATTKQLCKKATSIDQLCDDINKMVTIAMTRGTVLTKIRRTLAENGMRLLDDLVTRYGLVSTGSLGTNRKTAITLARVCACFPVKCVQIMLKGNIQHPDQVDGYPSCLCFPAAAALIPKHHQGMRDMYAAWSKKFAARTTRRGTTPSNEIAINLLDIGDNYNRNIMWNMAVLLMSRATGKVGRFTNGATIGRPDNVPTSFQEAIALVKYMN